MAGAGRRHEPGRLHRAHAVDVERRLRPRRRDRRQGPRRRRGSSRRSTRRSPARFSRARSPTARRRPPRLRRRRRQGDRRALVDDGGLRPIDAGRWRGPAELEALGYLHMAVQPRAGHGVRLGRDDRALTEARRGARGPGTPAPRARADGRQHAVGHLVDEDPHVTRVDRADVLVAQRVPRHLGDLAGALNPRRAAADDHERQPRGAARGILLDCCGLEGAQDPAPDGRGRGVRGGMDSPRAVRPARQPGRRGRAQCRGLDALRPPRARSGPTAGGRRRRASRGRPRPRRPARRGRCRARARACRPRRSRIRRAARSNHASAICAG